MSATHFVVTPKHLARFYNGDTTTTIITKVHRHNASRLLLALLGRMGE